MSDGGDKHGYETGRLNLPFVGLCTFGKYPYVEDWNAIGRYVCSDRVFEPDASRADAYRDAYALYRDLYRRLESLYPRLGTLPAA